MSLPDGIYTEPTTDGRLVLNFVHRGRYAIAYPLRGHAYRVGDDTSGWTRVADLPDLRMAEPQQIGYPVMAGCRWGEQPEPHLHQRMPSKADDDYPWCCAGDGAIKWSDLTDPRDLTPDEIAEHNLWTGGAR